MNENPFLQNTQHYQQLINQDSKSIYLYIVCLQITFYVGYSVLHRPPPY